MSISNFYIFDLDGTLADIEHRRSLLPDWDAFFKACVHDDPIVNVIDLMKTLWLAGNHVEIWSGRSDLVRDETEDWLGNHAPYYDLLRMRREGDFTPDDELKKQWLHECPLRPLIVFDDRQKVVDMWRNEGLVCAQVAPGDF